MLVMRLLAEASASASGNCGKGLHRVQALDDVVEPVGLLRHHRFDFIRRIAAFAQQAAQAVVQESAQVGAWVLELGVAGKQLCGIGQQAC